MPLLRVELTTRIRVAGETHADSTASVIGRDNYLIISLIESEEAEV